ncbi:MAG: hypothetical protein AB7E47_09855 [Desulfovibrionaceae bacterium]
MRRFLLIALCCAALLAIGCGAATYTLRGAAPATPDEDAVYALLQRRHTLLNEYRYASARGIFAGDALADFDADIKMNARRYAAYGIHFTLLDVREFEHSGDATAVSFYETTTEGGGTCWRVRADCFRTRNGWRIVGLERKRN